MNAVEIEAAISELALQPFDAVEFPYAFLSAFGNKDAMQKLDGLVLNSPADRVFTATRVKLVLESLARNVKDSHRQQHRQVEALKRELTAVTGGMERLYEGIETGMIKLDDVLRDRTDKLQAKRQAIISEIAGLKTQTTLPENLLQQPHIDACTKVLRAKLLESGAFAKEYLRLLVDEIRVNKQEVKLTGSYGAVAAAVAGNLGNSHGVPRFAPRWLPDQGSNLGPAD